MHASQVILLVWVQRRAMTSPLLMLEKPRPEEGREIRGERDDDDHDGGDDDDVDDDDGDDNDDGYSDGDDVNVDDEARY